MTKQEILEAVLDLACEKGLGSISMSQIADKVNLKKSSLYSHFKSKDEIIESMYTAFRNQAKAETGNGVTDYGKLVDGHTLHEILTAVVASYRTMNRTPVLDKFYRLVMSERTHNPLAAQIMVEETERMLAATRNLFYAVSAKGIAKFADPDSAALLFAMGIHSVLDFECDAGSAGSDAANALADRFIAEFCRIYGEEAKE